MGNRWAIARGQAKGIAGGIDGGNREGLCCMIIAVYTVMRLEGMCNYQLCYSIIRKETI